jgi:hypothetical protein
MSDDDILGNRLKRAGIDPKEYERIVNLETPSAMIMRKLDVYIKMEPGEAKTKYWEEIQALFPDAAAELREISEIKPSGYVLAEKLREEQKHWDEAHPAPKKPTFWNLLFGKRK